MACRLLIAEDAEDDIDGIIGYMMYPLCEDVFLSSKGYRKAVVDNYIVLYRLYGDDAAIISRVLYGRRNYAEII